MWHRYSLQSIGVDLRGASVRWWEWLPFPPGHHHEWLPLPLALHLAWGMTILSRSSVKYVACVKRIQPRRLYNSMKSSTSNPTIVLSAKHKDTPSLTVLTKARRNPSRGKLPPKGKKLCQEGYEEERKVKRRWPEPFDARLYQSVLIWHYNWLCTAKGDGQRACKIDHGFRCNESYASTCSHLPYHHKT